MTDESKRGANGGNARAANLTKEQRKSIASAAAKKRWDDKRARDAAKQEPDPPTPQPPVAPPVAPLASTVQPIQEKPVKAKKRAKLPKEFGAAHSYAEKRLAEAIRERAEAMGKVNMLNAEIPSLVQIIKALKSTDSPVFQNPQQYQTLDPQINYPPMGIDPMLMAQTIPQPMQSMPPIPMAHGGAVGGTIGDQQELPEDYFLRDTIVGGKFV